MDNTEKIEAIKKKVEIIRNLCYKHYSEFESELNAIEPEDEYDAWKDLMEQILNQIDRLHEYTQQF